MDQFNVRYSIRMCSKKSKFLYNTLLFLFIFKIGLAQQTQIVDFLKVTAQIEPIASEGKVKGTVAYSFKVLQKTDSIYLDAIAMDISNVALEGVRVSAAKDKIWLLDSFEVGREYTAFFSYEAIPKQTLYFAGDQIWTQGQGKYTSHWLPSIDDMNEKMEFDLTIISPSEKTTIANGKLVSTVKRENKTYWKWDMQQPMSSYLVAFAMGDFEKKSVSSKSGIPIELYYKPDDSSKVEPTYRYTQQLFDFMEAEIGVPFPWQNYKEVPVRDFLYAGMENTSATFFSEAFVVDSIGFSDRNYVNVNAHELAHQWFGNLVTETEGTHHWLHEGFATYFALLAEKEVFGEEYYYWKLYQSAEQLKALSDEGKGEVLLNPKASSLTFYEKGAWALHILKEQIGEETFKIAIKNYITKYQYMNVTTEDFLAEARTASGQDLKAFETDWLQQSAFKAEQAYESLIKSVFIKNYFEISALRGVSLKDKRLQLQTALTFPNDYIGQEAVSQLANEPISETLSLYKNGFDSNNLFVRQAIALSMETIPKQLQTEYESLLEDASYVTQEAALYNLWVQFPEKRAAYLDKMEGVVGFQNKNIRQLWLVLATVAEGYKVSEKPKFLDELKNYTASDFSFEIREVAFGYVHELQLWDEVTLKNLVNASVHHSWRFRNTMRKLLEEVLKNESYKSDILNEMESFSEKEKQYVLSKLTKE
jgi:aminopeptidase N